jgi:glycosyltransferase involved in cell wall biosynthesis
MRLMGYSLDNYMTNILSIVPYKFLPPTNGGHWGVLIVEKILSVFNNVNTVTTDNNELKKEYPFKVHAVFSNSKLRYLPFANYDKVYNVAKETKAEYIFCHHHYMFPMAKKVSKKLKVPLYIRCHNIEAERFRSTGKWWWKVMRYFERTAFRNSEGVFFVTDEDRNWAVEHYKLQNDKAIVMPFGIDFQKTPNSSKNKEELSKQYNLDPNRPWLFFMGQLDYSPNEDAVRFIIRDILSELKKRRTDDFHILICGKNLSAELQNEIKSISNNNDISYLGFVPDIESVIASCDVMMNPVIAGGGVKTKVVESLAWNKTVVSAYSGAIGIEASVCGDKLLVAPDGDWHHFVSLIESALQHPEHNIPDKYFNYYYAENIAARIQPYFNAAK